MGGGIVSLTPRPWDIRPPILRISPRVGQYEVYAWWTEGFWRTPLTQFEIRHSDGSDIVSWNQGINGGKWNLLGTYWFDEGIEGYVVITDVPADEPMLPVVIADAVMFKPVD